MPHRSPLELVRACLKAYETKDRAALEALIAADYRFTSPLDNGLDREAYLRICWPNSRHLASFEEVAGAEDGDRAFIEYVALTSDGHRFRNCEAHTTRNGQLAASHVYFGWNLPHRVPDGQHADQPG